MFKKELANCEHLSRGFNDSEPELETSLTVYEVYIELAHDKEGNVQKNKDGSDRYYAVDDEQVVALQEPVKVKKIRDNYFKGIFEVNGDVVEKVERDGKRIYYVVEEGKLVTLEAGTLVVAKNGYYRLPTEVGYALVDETDPENPRTIAVRKFQTEDHKAEAEEIVHTSRYVHRA